MVAAVIDAVDTEGVLWINEKNVNDRPLPEILCGGHIMSATGVVGPEWILEATLPALEERTRIRLMQCASKLWPRLRAFAYRASAMQASQEERDLLVTEIFEKVLVQSAKAMHQTTEPIVDLEAYIAAPFRHEFARRSKVEKRTRQTVQVVSPDELDTVQDDRSWEFLLAMESKLRLDELTRQMDDWTIQIWNLLISGMSWQEIGDSLQMTKEQVRQKFKYKLSQLKAGLARVGQRKAEVSR